MHCIYIHRAHKTIHMLNCTPSALSILKVRNSLSSPVPFKQWIRYMGDLKDIIIHMLLEPISDKKTQWCYSGAAGWIRFTPRLFKSGSMMSKCNTLQSGTTLNCMHQNHELPHTVSHLLPPTPFSRTLLDHSLVSLYSLLFCPRLSVIVRGAQT